MSGAVPIQPGPGVLRIYASRKISLHQNNAIDKIMKIQGNSFEFRNDEFKDYQFAEGRHYGFIAQVLEKLTDWKGKMPCLKQN